VTVVSGELRAYDSEAAAASDPDAGILVAMLTGTMMAVRDRPELVD
jgi:hypothetical protein